MRIKVRIKQVAQSITPPFKAELKEKKYWALAQH